MKFYYLSANWLLLLLLYLVEEKVPLWVFWNWTIIQALRLCTMLTSNNSDKELHRAESNVILQKQQKQRREVWESFLHFFQCFSHQYWRAGNPMKARSMTFKEGIWWRRLGNGQRRKMESEDSYIRWKPNQMFSIKKQIEKYFSRRNA